MVGAVEAGDGYAPGSVAARVAHDLRQVADSRTVPEKTRYFKALPGGYAEGDLFLGSTVPQGQAVARRYWQDATDADLVSLLESRWHEERHAALRLVGEIVRRSPPPRQGHVVRLVLAHRGRIDNWDLVDSWAPQVLGAWLLAPEQASVRRDLLDDLAASESVWDRRTAVTSTFAAIRADDHADTLHLAERLLDDPHHLVHKAVGWMLREVGIRDVVALERFLDAHAPGDAPRDAAERHRAARARTTRPLPRRPAPLA